MAPSEEAWNRDRGVKLFSINALRSNRWQNHSRVEGRKVTGLPIEVVVEPREVVQPLPECGDDVAPYSNVGAAGSSAQFSAVGIPITEPRARPADSPLTILLQQIPTSDSLVDAV